MSAFGFPPPNDPGLSPPLQYTALNVMSGTYGAKGDGVTDDTAAVQRALNDANTLYGKTGAPALVVLPAGYMFLLGRLNINSGILVWAYGAAIIPNLNNMPTTTALFYWGVSAALSNFAIRGGKWLGTGAETGTGGGDQQLFYAITGAGAVTNNLLFQDMDITNWGSGPIYCRNPTVARVLDCHMDNCCQNTTFNCVTFVYDQNAVATSGLCIARGNVITNAWSDAIAQAHAAGSAILIAKTIFTGNLCTANPNATIGANPSDNAGAIAYEVDVTQLTANGIIAHNDIDAFASGLSGNYAIFAGENPAFPTIEKLLIDSNVIRCNSRGVLLNVANPSGVSVVNNAIDAPSEIVANQGKAALQRGNRFSLTGAMQGTATLAAGTVTINTTEVRTGDIILISRTARGGTSGNLAPGAITNATSFVVNSDNAADTGTFYWELIH